MSRDSRITITPMNEPDARAIVSWRYEPPYDLYNLDAEPDDDLVASFTDPASCYFSLHDEAGVLIAFICFGAEARVPGGDYSDDALDVGCGIAPELTGCGLGPSIIETAVQFGQETYGATRFRSTIAEFNERALRAARKAGFVPIRTFDRPSDGRPFVMLERGFD